MGPVVVIGENARVRGFALAGATIFAANSDAAARAHWSTMPHDVALVILTTKAADALAKELAELPSDVLVVTMP